MFVYVNLVIRSSELCLCSTKEYFDRIVMNVDGLIILISNEELTSLSNVYKNNLVEMCINFHLLEMEAQEVGQKKNQIIDFHNDYHEWLFCSEDHCFK